MNTDRILQELEDRFKVDHLAIYEQAADALAAHQAVCDKMFRALSTLFQQTEQILSPSHRMIVQESLQSYEMLTTFFGEEHE
jgi:hypothetical protein